MRTESFRPIERVILRLHNEDNTAAEIAVRIGKKPGTVSRIMEMMEYKKTIPLQDDSIQKSRRPVERVIARLRAAGESYGEIGNRLGRSGSQVRRIESYAEFRD